MLEVTSGVSAACPGGEVEKVSFERQRVFDFDRELLIGVHLHGRRRDRVRAIDHERAGLIRF
jgi:hypothetical protein